MEPTAQPTNKISKIYYCHKGALLWPTLIFFGFLFDYVLAFCCFFCFICHFYPPFTRKRIVSLYFGREVRTRLGVAFFEVYGPPVFHIKAGRPVKCLAQGHNKRTCRLVLHNLP